MSNELDSILPTIALRKFPPIMTEYGAKGPGSIERTASIECPKCKALDNFYSSTKRRVFRSSYCEGNQPAEHVHRNFIGQEHKHLVLCAGITAEHIHIACAICDHVSLWELPKTEAEQWPK